MKFICRELLFIIILFQTFSLSAQSNIDVLHYKFELGLNDQNDSIYGYAEIKLRFLQPISSITFDLASTNVQGKGMKVDRVTSGLDEPLEFNEQNDKVNIILLKQSGINDSANFTIFYHGVPRDGLIISKNKYGDRTFFADNWPDRAHYWIPCKDEPG